MPLDPFLKALVPGFVEESNEIIARVSRDLFALEKKTDWDAEVEAHTSGVARGLHTLKGSAGSLGLDDLAHLAHRLEDLVTPARAAKKPLAAEAADTILRALDLFKERLAAYVDDAAGPPLDDVLRAIAALVGGAPVEAPRSAREAPHDDEDADLETTALRAPADLAATPIDALDVEAGGADEDTFGFRVDAQEIALLIRDLERLREVRLRLEDRARELAGAAAMLERLGAIAGDARPIVTRAERLLRGDGDECSAVLDSLEERVREIGMRPVRAIFDQLQRVTRDVSRKSRKEARLSLVGGETSLDRRTLQAVRGALVQLIHNAIDHGIEAPDVRERAGKHREGAIVIRVEQQGNMVFLELSDDGGGLDLARIAEVAAERGIIARRDVAKLKPAELQSLIFAPGFSTRAEVSATSGRGAGMDVVKKAIESLHGHVDVYSVPKEGTRFVLTVPIDVGASPVVVVAAGDQELGVPMLGVQKMLVATRSNLRLDGDLRRIVVDETELPLHDLGALLGLRHESDPSHNQPVMILEAQGRRAGILVDRVVGERELVIRALPNEVGATEAFAGASMGAQGELVLVLRPTWLVSARPLDTTSERTRRALVVDDSITARALHRAMLEIGGYVVHTASSATAALERLERTRYDVIVCDVGMEAIDGYELTRRVRANRELRDVPIILVSGHDAEADRPSYREAGADAFLGKRECAAGRLLAEVTAIVQRRAAARGEPPRSSKATP